MFNKSFLEEATEKASKMGKCPFCSTEIPLRKTEKLLDYGNVIKRCPHCNNYFYDKRVKELALTGITNDDRKLVRKGARNVLSVGIFELSIGFVLLMIFGFKYLFFIGFIWSILGIICTIQDILSHKTRLELLEKELIISKNRMSLPQYAERVMSLQQK